MPQLDSDGRSALDRAIVSKRIGQIILTQKLLQGMLGIDAGDVIAIQQEEHERLSGTFRVFVVSGRLQPIPEGEPAPYIQLEDVR